MRLRNPAEKTSTINDDRLSEVAVFLGFEFLSNQIPPVPDGVMPATPQLVVTSVLAVVSLVAVGAVLVATWRTRSPMWSAVLIGGLLATFNEPIVDILGGCMHYRAGQWQVFETFDRPIPVWVALAYLLFFGAVPVGVQRLLEAPAPRRRFWQVVTVIWVVNLAIEVPVLGSGLYVYYGVQPFKLLGFPLYWLAVNSLGVGSIAILLYRFRSFLSRGRGYLAALVLPFTAQLAAVGLAGLPVFSTYNTGLSAPWKWIGAAATIVIGVVALRALSTLLPVSNDRPIAGGPSTSSRRPAPSRA